MTKGGYREDDLLSAFGKYLSSNDYLILALSGNQQGRYWFQMDNLRKAPDIIAYRHDLILVGEAKVKSRDLFKCPHGRKSDYQSLQFLLDNDCAKIQIVNSIKTAITNLTVIPVTMPPIKAIVVGGDSFAGMEELLFDSRIWCFTVDKESGETIMGNDNVTCY